MRTPDKKDATTKPSARPPCAVTPRSVSVAKLRPESCVTVKAMSNAATRVPANMGISNDKAIAIPSIAAWAVASPKYAILRQTTKQPNGAAISATPTPAIEARTIKSSNISV